MTDHRVFLEAAIRLSRDNVTGGSGGPFGAVIVKDGVILESGANEVTAANDPTAHAEVVAIRRACTALKSFSLHGCILYSSCEPCPMCLSAAYWARVEAVYFAATQADAAEAGFDDAFLYRELALPRGDRALPAHAVAESRNDARAAFNLWIQNAEKIRY